MREEEKEMSGGEERKGIKGDEGRKGVNEWELGKK